MNIRFQADNDLKYAIVKAVRRREPAIDFVSAHDAGLEGIGDPEILQRAAADKRVLVSHDRQTMLNHFRNHLLAGKPSSGLLIVSQGTPIGTVAEAIILLWAAMDPAELRGQAFLTLTTGSPRKFSAENRRRHRHEIRMVARQYAPIRDLQPMLSARSQQAQVPGLVFTSRKIGRH